MLEELKKTMDKGILKKVFKVSTKEYINKDKNYKKKPNRKSGAEKYINWNEKFTWGFNSIFEQTKELLNLKTGQIKLSSLRRKNKEENQRSPRNLWDTIKHMNIDIMRVTEREERETERIFEEIMAENIQS